MITYGIKINSSVLNLKSKRKKYAIITDTAIITESINVNNK